MGRGDPSRFGKLQKRTRPAAALRSKDSLDVRASVAANWSHKNRVAFSFFFLLDFFSENPMNPIGLVSPVQTVKTGGLWKNESLRRKSSGAR
jgi:hypothetical protein